MSRRRWNPDNLDVARSRSASSSSAAGSAAPGRRRLFVLLPAFNEEDVIRPLLLSIARTISVEKFDPLIVIVDDGSRDRTVAEAEKAASDWERLRRSGDVPPGAGPMPLTVLHHDFNRGLGAALRTGFFWCLKYASDRDVIVTLDADNTHPPSLIPQLAHALDAGFDLAIASRYRQGARVQGVPGYRRFLSDGGRYLMQALFPIRGVRDYTCCFRAYRVKLLRRAQVLHGEALCSAQGFEAVMDLLLQLRPLRPRCVELPLDLNYTSRVGRSKMNVMTNVRRTLSLIARRFIGGGSRSMAPAHAPTPAPAARVVRTHVPATPPSPRPEQAAGGSLRARR